MRNLVPRRGWILTLSFLVLQFGLQGCLETESKRKSLSKKEKTTQEIKTPLEDANLNEDNHLVDRPAATVQPKQGIYFCGDIYSTAAREIKCENRLIGFLELEKLKRMVSLDKLTLSNVGLQEFPTSILNLHGLISVDLSRNQITYIEADFSQMRLLSELNLSSNNLIHIPRNINTALFLLNLDLSNNNILSVANELKIFGRLKNVDLSNNPIAGSTYFQKILESRLATDAKVNCPVKELGTELPDGRKNPMSQFLGKYKIVSSDYRRKFSPSDYRPRIRCNATHLEILGKKDDISTPFKIQYSSDGGATMSRFTRLYFFKTMYIGAFGVAHYHDTYSEKIGEEDSLSINQIGDRFNFAHSIRTFTGWQTCTYEMLKTSE